MKAHDHDKSRTARGAGSSIDHQEDGQQQFTRSRFLRHSAALVGGAFLAQAGIACGDDRSDAGAKTGDTSTLPDYEGRTLTISDVGGNISDAYRAAYYQPFEEATGATIKVAPMMTMGALKGQAARDAPSWDLADSSPSQLDLAARAGYVQPIDYSKVPIATSGALRIPQRYKYSVPWLSFSNVLAWNTDLVDGEPTGWADFFDVNRYPGKRSYISYIDFGGFEPPLLADGVPADDVNSVLAAKNGAGVQRSIAKLGELAPAISLWWAAGAEPAQALANGSVAMAYAWTGRIRPLVNDGAPINLTFNEGIVVYGALGVIKGSRNLDMAHTFINFSLDPTRQATMAELTTYGPTNKKAIDLIARDERANVSTLPEHLDKQIYLAEDWTADNYTYLTKEYSRALSEFQG